MGRYSNIVDHRGNPIDRGQLTEEIAAPSLTGIRQAWTYGSVAAGLTPGRLAAMLQAAADNNPADYLQLAEEMEERDLHYASVIGTRKRAVAGLEVAVEAYADDERSQMLADEVRDLVRKPAFSDMVDDLLDAIGKGFSTVEIMWRTKGRKWLPAYEHRDPRWFRFDRESGRQLRLVSGTDPDGEPLPAYKFLCHFPRIKSGLPIRGGVARLAAFSYMCKAWTVKDWMTFADVFGMPLRIGKYGPSATDDEKATLKTAVANIASDAAAIIPDSMLIEFQAAAQSAGGPDMFLKLAEWLDRQVSKGVIGQTMTADDGASLSQAKVHNDVRLDIVEADARQLSATINRDLVKPFIDLNFGAQEDYPRLFFVTPQVEDLALLAGNLEKLVPLGLRVGQGVIRDKLGLPDPDEGDELLTPPGQAAPPAIANQRVALHREQDTAPDYAQVAAATVGRAVEPAVRDWLDVVRAILESAESLEEAREQIAAAYGDLDIEAAAGTLGEALAAAELAGRFEAESGES